MNLKYVHNAHRIHQVVTYMQYATAYPLIFLATNHLLVSVEYSFFGTTQKEEFIIVIFFFIQCKVH